MNLKTQIAVLLLIICGYAGIASGQTGNCNQQVSRACSDIQTITVSGQFITIPNNGGLVPSFEVVIQGSVAPVSLTVVINGCATSGTCDVLDTYTTVANSLRAPTVSKVYDHYTVSATWTGGTGVAIKINTQITSARLEPPTSLPPSGPAGGDLSGNFPNPTVAKVNGGVIPVSKSVVGTNSLGQVIDATSVLSNYLPLSGGAGYPLTGPLTLSGNATLPLQAVPLQQVVPNTGGTYSGVVGSSIGQFAQQRGGPFTIYQAFGDSITAGYLVTAAQAYPSLLTTTEGIPVVNYTNYGTSGDQACDMTYHVFNDATPIYGSQQLYTTMVGTNDAAIKGTGSYEAVFNLCQLAGLAYLGTPSANIVTYGTLTGSWTADTTYSKLTGIKSTTNGDTFTWPAVYTNGTIYMWYRIIDGNGGTFTYAVDGGTTTAVSNSTTPSIATQNGGTQSVALLRITGLTAGSHVITTTVTSATGAGNIVGILGLAAPQPVSGVMPVYAGLIPYRTGNATPTAPAQYNVDITSNVATLNSDGQNVTLVNDRRYMFGTSAEMQPDQTHLTVLGQQHIAQAFQDAINGIVNPLANSQPIQTGVSASGAMPVNTPGSPELIIYGGSGTITLSYPTSGINFGKTYTICNYSTNNASFIGLSGSSSNTQANMTIGKNSCGGATYIGTTWWMVTTMPQIPAKVPASYSCSTSGYVFFAESSSPSNGQSWETVTGFLYGCVGSYTYTFTTPFYSTFSPPMVQSASPTATAGSANVAAAVSAVSATTVTVTTATSTTGYFTLSGWSAQ